MTDVREVDVVWLFVVHIGISREIERLPWTGKEFVRELGSQTSDPFVPFWLSVVSLLLRVSLLLLVSFFVALGIASDKTYVRCRDVRFVVNRVDRRKARRRNERVCTMVWRNVGMMYRRAAKLRLNCSSIFVGPLLCRLSVGRLLVIRVVRLSDGMYV